MKSTQVGYMSELTTISVVFVLLLYTYLRYGCAKCANSMYFAQPARVCKKWCAISPYYVGGIYIAHTHCLHHDRAQCDLHITQLHVLLTASQSGIRNALPSSTAHTNMGHGGYSPGKESFA